MQCTGNEINLTDCSFLKLQFEEGKRLANQISVAGVSCKDPQAVPVSKGDGDALTTIVLLSILGGTLSIIIVALGVR